APPGPRSGRPEVGRRLALDAEIALAPERSRRVHRTLPRARVVSHGVTRSRAGPPGPPSPAEAWRLLGEEGADAFAAILGAEDGVAQGEGAGDRVALRRGETQGDRL